MKAGDNFILDGVNCLVLRLYSDGYCDYLRRGEVLTVRQDTIAHCAFRGPTRPRVHA